MTRTPGGRPVRVGLRGVLPALLVLVPLGCTFERRPDGRGAADPRTQALSVEDSVRSVVEALDDARRRGDLAAALSLFDTAARVTPPVGAPFPDSLGGWLSPDLALGYGWTPGAPGGSPLELLESRVEILPGGTALSLGRYVDPAGGGAPASLETLLLIRGPAGWRIRHLHRSSPSQSPVP